MGRCRGLNVGPARGIHVLCNDTSSPLEAFDIPQEQQGKLWTLIVKKYRCSTAGAARPAIIVWHNLSPFRPEIVLSYSVLLYWHTITVTGTRGVRTFCTWCVVLWREIKRFARVPESFQARDEEAAAPLDGGRGTAVVAAQVFRCSTWRWIDLRHHPDDEPKQG